ncbi:MAG: hypothetical protein FDZ75_04545 [Actinobacteria bacterium]|nr:MAG: hypothetical protein FDZ75_04545 [Actinomycetota bacterium]
MNISVSTAGAITDSECISCNECVNVCPAAGALEIAAPAGRKLSPTAVSGIVVGLLAVIIAASTVAGAFAWRMPTLGEAVREQGTATQNEFDTSLIKGYMSMKEIS